MKNISILMSTYNGEKFLDKQLNSIKDQDIKDDFHITVVVRDDGSNDNTLKILESWKEDLDLKIIQGNNIGSRNSFYWLIANAQDSDYYAFCDQDDIWKKEKLSVGISKIRLKNTLYFSNASYIDENDRLIGKNFLQNDFKLSLRRIFMCNPANGCTMIWDYSLHILLKTINYSTFTMHDEFVCTVAAVLGNIVYDNKPYVFYRLHRDNVTQTNNFLKKYKIWKSIWFGRKTYQIDMRAKELLKQNISYNSKKVLEEISEYKNNTNRFKIACKYKCEDKKVQRSFRIRILLKLI